ncbi:hypothetical protein D3C81_1992830 [compost metagenome]
MRAVAVEVVVAAEVFVPVAVVTVFAEVAAAVVAVVPGEQERVAAAGGGGPGLAGEGLPAGGAGEEDNQ